MPHAICKQGEESMPVYTYRCDSCGVQFERQQSFHDDPLKTCPECKKKTVKRIITPTKVIFKGSGFYANDHKSSSNSGSSSSKKHDHDHDHDHSGHSHGDESKSADKPAAEKKKSTKNEASE
jgi:putative FmdB family regulatory protein